MEARRLPTRRGSGGSESFGTETLVIPICILTFLPAGNDGGDLSELRNGGLLNPDGFGWAIVAGRKILTGHSLDLEEALASFRRTRAKHLKGPALFHSRYATHGSICTDNCHPFRVGGDKRMVLAHNGIMPSDAHPFDGDDRSDSKIFADELMPVWTDAFTSPRIKHELEQWLGWNKVVVLSTRHKNQALILNEEEGIWSEETGMWHSNADFEPVKFSPRVRYWTLPETVDVCVTCHTITEDPDVCEACFSCRYCETVLDMDGKCFCWDPKDEFPSLARLALEASAQGEDNWWNLAEEETVDL